MAFFIQPALADIDGNPGSEVLAGNGLYTLDGVTGSGQNAPGWPKLTGGWTVGTPAVGTRASSSHTMVAVVRRDGTLLVWETDGSSDEIDWPRAGGNLAGSGTGVGGSS